MRPTILLRGTAAWLALLPGLFACGASKSDFINDDPEVTNASAGGSSSQGPASSGNGDTGGTAAGGSTSGTESGATGTTSGAGGTGNPTTGGVTNGSHTTGPSGGSSSSSTSASTTTAGGQGGDGGGGGAPQRDCREDADCGLAKDISACCAGCTAAYPADAIADDPCLLGKGEQDAGKCDRPVCTDVACPTIACEEPVYAACDAGQCVAKNECPEGTLLDKGSCVPPCTMKDDCVIATRAGECCESCPDAYHRQALEEDACLIPSGKPAPGACQPAPDECALVLCPAVLCLGPGSPVCNQNGLCEMTGGLTE